MHRAENILQTIETLLTGLTTTGVRVQRARIRTVETAPALSIEMADDSVDPDRSSWPRLARVLGVKIIAHVKDNADAEGLLNTIRSEVYVAMLADNTLGLSYVTDTMLVSDDEPEFTGEADQKVGVQQMNYAIDYRHAWSTPEV